MRQLALLVTLLSLSLYPAIALSGPFGIEMGMSIDKLNTADMKSQGMIDLENPPKPHPKLKHYTVMHTKETGVCLVNALTGLVRNDKYGKDIKRLFKKLKGQLEGKYGDFEDLQYMDPDGLWDERDEWMMSINKGERQYASIKENLKGDIEYIDMQVLASGPSAGAIKIMYKFSNFEECDKVISESSASTL
ncbi:hypothetical protein [Thiohalorhabdus denitrificans]|uniref:Uncharacterized protein n=1 Tax=Thiohalorhabdus denitrificans TaxID=381306 RepID=A0A1G5FCG9_9GAMM|nr:hypothetical protein [Thiohalorhabdus denitrificans]SCY36580.1 hypothetical protein SAMN05661077_1894 [Thiohalorhabdus denitrificans]